MSWNLYNFGRKKSDEDIAFMASILSRADIVAVQEVTAGKDFGVQAVAKLADALSRTGTSWDYIVSDPTVSSDTAGVERYAYLFKSSMVSINRREAHLVNALEGPIDREPYTLLFVPKKVETLRIFTIHAVPTAKHPINEVAALVAADELKDTPRAIVAGDFNLGPGSTDKYFESIGYTGHIIGLTSLNRKVKGERYLAHQYDNIYTKGIEVCTAGIVDFVQDSFAPVADESLKRAHRISDHLPVFATFR
jgi:endonuclease/exonuclease/phosphatase family metal-dependent hydrolase